MTSSTGRADRAAAELVEHVDELGDVVAVVSRGEMRQRGLRHRCTYVAVVTSDEELVVHQRADWKDVYPGWWDLCFGGICGVGENWVDAALRELAEEAGLDTPLEYLAEVVYEGDDGAVLGHVFLARTDVDPTCPDGEVVAIDRVAMEVLPGWLEGHAVCHDTRHAVLPVLLDRLGTEAPGV